MERNSDVLSASCHLQKAASGDSKTSSVVSLRNSMSYLPNSLTQYQLANRDIPRGEEFIVLIILWSAALFSAKAPKHALFGGVPGGKGRAGVWEGDRALSLSPCSSFDPVHRAIWLWRFNPRVFIHSLLPSCQLNQVLWCSLICKRLSWFCPQKLSS